MMFFALFVPVLSTVFLMFLMTILTLFPMFHLKLLNAAERNVLKEAIMKYETESYWADLVDRAKANPFCEKYAKFVIKEGITSDIAGALGRMQAVVVEAAVPNLIGRQMIDVMPVQDALVRFPKAKVAKAYETAELSEYYLTGEKYETTDIKADIEIKAGVKWSKRFYEDAAWPVLERQAKEIGRAIGELETGKIFSLYDGIAAGNLAGGGVQSTGDGASFAWADVVLLWNTVQKENWNADVLAINPAECAGIFVDDKFIHGFYAPSSGPEMARTGVIGITKLGMKIVVSTKITAATKLAIDTRVAAVMLVRRDLITEPFEDPSKDQYGIVASERIGLGVLRSKAVAKGT